MLLSAASSLNGYKVQIINATPYQADFSVRTTLINCCHGEQVGDKCKKTLNGFELGEIDSGCSLACWDFLDATVLDTDKKEKIYLKRDSPLQTDIEGRSILQRAGDNIGCGDAKVFLYVDYVVDMMNTSIFSRKLELGNKSDYLKSLSNTVDYMFRILGGVVYNTFINAKANFEIAKKNLKKVLEAQPFDANNAIKQLQEMYDNLASAIENARDVVSFEHKQYEISTMPLLNSPFLKQTQNETMILFLANVRERLDKSKITLFIEPAEIAELRASILDFEKPFVESQKQYQQDEKLIKSYSDFMIKLNVISKIKDAQVALDALEALRTSIIQDKSMSSNKFIFNTFRALKLKNTIIKTAQLVETDKLAGTANRQLFINTIEDALKHLKAAGTDGYKDPAIRYELETTVLTYEKMLAKVIKDENAAKTSKEAKEKK